MNRSKKSAVLNLLIWVLVVAVAAACGWLGASLMGGLDLPAGGIWVLMAGLVGGIFLQLILHEAGHLVCGLATGYGFVSFRIGSWMLIRRDGKLRWCRFSLPGTGGQCLLSPPPWREEGFPVFAYNLGGPAVNLITAALCGLGCWLLGGTAPMAAAALAGIAVAGLYLGLVNGIPLKISGMPNDGYNALHLGKDTLTRRALWAQLAINAAQMEGKRLRDLPEDWFRLPEDTGPRDPLAGAVWVFRYNRLVDEGRYREAAELGKQLLENGRLAALHQYVLEADQGLFLLWEGRTREGLDILHRREIRAFCKQMKGNPGTLLETYAAALAAGKTREAGRLRDKLIRSMASWPYTGETETVRDMLARTEEALCKSVTEPETELWHTEKDRN